jgi:pilus assembly protein Flp/PilA
MLKKPVQNRRRGSVLVEYALLIAGIVLVSVVAIAVLGHKTSDNFGVMAAVMPGAHVEDNVPIASANAIPFVSDGSKLILDSTKLVDPNGALDRMQGVLGAGGGEKLIIDQ